MAAEDIALLAEALSKTYVGDGELSYKGRGLKLDNAESVEELVREIKQYQGLRALRLEGNTFGVEAAHAIAKALESKNELQRCHWSDMFTGRLRSEIPTALQSLGGALMMSGARLAELDLSDNAFGPDGVRGIEELLKSHSCHALRELRLNNCGMGIGGGKILAAALIESHSQSSALGAPLKLRVFIAGRNRLENEGATALAKAFKLMGSLEEVHMPQNGINHPGVTALATAMQHNTNLRVLNLNDNTFTKKGAIAMAQALRNLRNIQVINFGDCLVRSEGAIAISAILRDGLPILKELNLSFGELTEAAALVVAQAVKDKPHMERLDLNGNCLGEEGCEALKEAMQTMDREDLLASLSDDEGEPDDEEEEDNDEENQSEEENDEEEEEEEEDNEKKEEDEDEDRGIKENEPTSPKKPQSTANCSDPEVMSFLNGPTAEKLLQLGEKRTLLVEQVDVSETGQTADIWLQISSLYREEMETRKAVLETTDGVLKKVLSGSPLQSYSFLSTLLVRMGLLKGERKVLKVPVVPGHLLCLEHAVQQDFFPLDHVTLLHTFLSRSGKGFESCDGARESLESALEKRSSADY